MSVSNFCLTRILHRWQEEGYSRKIIISPRNLIHRRPYHSSDATEATFKSASYYGALFAPEMPASLFEAIITAAGQTVFYNQSHRNKSAILNLCYHDSSYIPNQSRSCYILPVTIRTIAAKSILTKSNLPVSDYSANPYVGCEHSCRYCYASFMKRFTGHSEEWGSFVDVKTWPAMKHPEKYSGREVFLSSVTDPYQPLEEKYCRTRRLLEELSGHNVKLSIATKSDLVLRDIELIATFPNARVSWSINTLDESFRAEMDCAVSISRRLEAMRKFHEAGIRTTCFISPIFPGITDVPAIIERVKGMCNLVWLEDLNLRGGFKAGILSWVHENRPELCGLYREIYSEGDLSYWRELDGIIHDYCAGEGLPYARNDDSVNMDYVPPVDIGVRFPQNASAVEAVYRCLKNAPVDIGGRFLQDAPTVEAGYRCLKNAPVVVNYFYHSEIVRHK